MSAPSIRFIERLFALRVRVLDDDSYYTYFVSICYTFCLLNFVLLFFCRHTEKKWVWMMNYPRQYCKLATMTRNDSVEDLMMTSWMRAANPDVAVIHHRHVTAS